MMHSNTNVLSNAGTFDSFDMFGLSNRASAQQQKDFRKLEARIISMCTDQCHRRELHYESHTEFCMGKCYDLSYIYIRTGIAEITAFTYENNINS